MGKRKANRHHERRAVEPRRRLCVHSPASMRRIVTPFLLALVAAASGGILRPAAVARVQRSTVDDVARRWGLEVALLKEGWDIHMHGADKAAGVARAGDLLKRYGPAYLIMSISLAAVSYSTCHYAVSRGVNVAALLSKFGISSSVASEKVGVASIAYVCHKAASPLRFPPTVALTPVVARRLFGRSDIA